MEKKEVYGKVLEYYERVKELIVNGERDHALDVYIEMLSLYDENDLAEVEHYGLPDPFEGQVFFFYNALNIIGILKSLTMAKDIYNRRGDIEKTIDFKKYLSVVYVDMIDYDQAEVEISDAIYLCDTISYEKGKIDLYNSWGKIKDVQGKDDEALDIYLQAYNRALEIEYEFGKRIAHNIGELYFKRKDYVKALEFVEIGLKVIQENKVYNSLANSYSAMGRIHSEMGQLEKAKGYFEKALECAHKYKVRNTLSEAYLALSKLNEREGNYKGAYDLLKMHINIAELINKDKERKQMNKIRTSLNPKNDADEHELIKLKNIELELLSDELRQTNDFLEDTLAANQQVQAELMEKNTKLEDSLETLNKTKRQLIESERVAAVSKIILDIADEMGAPLSLSVSGLNHFNDELLRVFNHTINGKLKRSELMECFENGFKALEYADKNLKELGIYINRLKTNPESDIEMKDMQSDIAEILDKVIEDNEAKIELKKCDVLVNYSGDVQVRAPESLLTTLFDYLLNNVLNYGFNDPYDNLIKFDIEGSDEGVKITYWDNGNSIESHVIERAFNSDLDEGGIEHVNREYDLLQIHSHVVSFLMGKIKCWSTEEEGTVIEILLPRNVRIITT